MMVAMFMHKKTTEGRIRRQGMGKFDKKITAPTKPGNCLTVTHRAFQQTWTVDEIRQEAERSAENLGREFYSPPMRA